MQMRQNGLLSTIFKLSWDALGEKVGCERTIRYAQAQQPDSIGAAPTKRNRMTRAVVFKQARKVRCQLTSTPRRVGGRVDARSQDDHCCFAVRLRSNRLPLPSHRYPGPSNGVDAGILVRLGQATSRRIRFRSPASDFGITRLSSVGLGRI